MINLMLCNKETKNVKVIDRTDFSPIELQSSFLSFYSSFMSTKTSQGGTGPPVGPAASLPTLKSEIRGREAARTPSAASWAKNRSFQVLVPCFLLKLWPWNQMLQCLNHFNPLHFLCRLFAHRLCFVFLCVYPGKKSVLLPCPVFRLCTTTHKALLLYMCVFSTHYPYFSCFYILFTRYISRNAILCFFFDIAYIKILRQHWCHSSFCPPFPLGSC